MSDSDRSTNATTADLVQGSNRWDMKIDDGVLALSGTVDFTNARQILESVQSQLKSDGPGVIDLAGITRSNSAGLAVMIEWLSVARRQNLQLGFINVPQGLRELAKVCQVDDLLPID